MCMSVSFMISQIFFARSIKWYLVVVLAAMGLHLNIVGLIEKIPLQANLYCHTGSSIKISGWFGPGTGFQSGFSFLYEYF